MRVLVLAAPVLLALSACGSAKAITPDNHNPAHCIAAFNNAAYWFKIGQKPEKVTAMMARGAFEMEKAKAAGHSAAATLAEGEAFTEAYAKDQTAVDALFLACGAAQDANPRFREELPELLARVRSAQAALPVY